MEGNQSRQRESCWVSLAALMIASSFAADVRGQECDAGNPCEQSDSASQAAITPNTGANNPIDVVGGNKYQREVDFELPGELALSFVRHYNSSSVQGGAFGGGWSHGFETSLLREERKQADGSVTITLTIRQADGRHIVFTAFSSPDSSVTRYASAPFGYGVIEESPSAIEALREASSDSESHTNGRGLTPWRWRWLDGKELIFDGTGTLKTIRSPSGESLDLQHDRHGRLVRVADHASRDLVLSYWDQPSDWLPSFDTDRGEVRGQRHRLKSVRLPSGESITYYYDANGLLARIARADQTSKRYEYVESTGVLRLSRIVDREGITEGTYGYDANGFANYSAQSHDADAVQVQRTEPTVKEGLGTSVLLTRDGARTTYSWRRSPHGIPLLVEAQGPGCQTCPRSNVRYTYTKDGLLQRIDDLASGTAEILARDALGRITARHEERNASTRLAERYEYVDNDPLSKPARIVRPSVADGELHVFELEYNERGQPTHLTERGYAPARDAASYVEITRTISYAYYDHSNGAANLIGKLKWIDGPLPGTSDRVLYFYDARGSLNEIHHSSQHIERFRFDALGRLREHVPLDGVPITIGYDAENRISEYTRAQLHTLLTHDARGRLAQVRDPIGQVFTFSYDGASRIIAVEDSGKNRIELDFDAQGRPIARRLHNPDGSISQEMGIAPELAPGTAAGQQRISDSLLPVLRLPVVGPWSTAAQSLVASSREGDARSIQELVDARGLKSQYAFDDFGRLVHSYNPDSGAIFLEYDAADRVVARHFADNRSVQYSYDELGRLVWIEAGEDTVTVEYGEHGKPARITYAAGEERFAYDAAARLVRRERWIDGLRFEHEYRYDALGRLSESVLPDGKTLLYRYNPTIHAKPGVLSSIERKRMFGATTIISGLNESDDRYDLQTSVFGNGLPFERGLTRSGQLSKLGTKGIAHFEFQHDEQGRIADVSGATNRQFKYDDGGRINRSTQSIHPAIGNQEEFAFDPADNLRITGGARRYSLLRVDQASNRVLARTNANGTVEAYSYDAAGRTTRIGDRRLTYDGFGRLDHVVENDRVVAEYSYNAFGERIRKVTYAGNQRRVTYFFYDGSKLTAEADARGEITRHFVYLHDRVVAMLSRDRSYAIHTDWRGAPVAATDERQRVAWRADVEVFGTLNSESGELSLPLRGSNQYFDPETGFHYNLNRYFDPSTARYLTPDPLGQAGGLNLYAFVSGDPVNVIDPFGLQAIPADWGTMDRVGALLGETLRALPSAGYDAMVEALRDLISPAGLAVTATMFTAWAASQFTPFGWAADVAILGVGFVFMGIAIAELAMGTAAAYRAMRDAETLQDLCAAGRDFAKVLAEAAIELGGGGGIAGAARAGSRQLAAQMRRMFGQNSRAPPPGPLPFTLEMPARVVDGFGNQIRQFMAGRDHMWTTPAERARWRALEDAAESFARKYFNATHVINAKHNNGTPNPGGSNGFDLVFVNQQGRLVIGEAKSGRVTPMTAFGAGARGDAQLQLNLDVLVQRIRSLEGLPIRMKDELIRQIETRTFETQLYLSPRSTIANGRLDIFAEATGRPLDAIYILPEAPPARD